MVDSGASLEPVGEGGVVGQGAGWHDARRASSTKTGEMWSKMTGSWELWMMKETQLKKECTKGWLKPWESRCPSLRRSQKRRCLGNNY